MMKYFLFTCLCSLALASGNILAASHVFPSGCRDAGYSFKYKVLMLHPDRAGKPQSIYFIHNKTLNRTIKLHQMRTGEEPYIIHLNNTIKPNQWGVFATDEGKVKFICTKSSKKSIHGEVTDCKNVIELCEYTNVKFAVNNHGSYWVVDSKKKYSARNEAIRQGILLKW